MAAADARHSLHYGALNNDGAAKATGSRRWVTEKSEFSGRQLRPQSGRNAIYNAPKTRQPSCSGTQCFAMRPQI